MDAGSRHQSQPTATLHMTKDGKRSSVQTYLADSVSAKNPDGSKKFPLDIRTNCLVSKVLFDHRDHGKPKAVGVEFLEGKSLYVADPRFNKDKQGIKKHAYASKETVTSGGTFNTPQILKLSGTGPASELKDHSIPVIVDLPGVGANLQDNYGFGVVNKAAMPFNVFANCTFGAMRPMSKNKENGIYLYGGPLKFSGFFPGYSRVTEPSAWTWGVLKQHPRNHGSKAGTITLISDNPRAVPRVRFNPFAEGAEKDLEAMVESVEIARKIIMNVAEPTGPFAEQEPGSEVDTTSEVKQFIKNQVFSHHATSTCKIGADDDKMACLDSEFRVRGVDGLRVVDASDFPRIPGSFPVILITMVSEKASDVMLKKYDKSNESF
ncbi:GMC oxidoreductase [Lophiostoma macrostomum CBS 122681]|uniref:GMC oxidoreductase n=1 Tax=Lophiostoma macrostomum CBS 122681 TaxID=1314788 RepID=A0A6A6TBU6_9PLEO|nr:GMC oxidoreductase [Lophiostoma macrostomum CBS 122681]